MAANHLGVIGAVALLYFGQLAAVMLVVAVAGFRMLVVHGTTYAAVAHVYQTFCRAAGWLAVRNGQARGCVECFCRCGNPGGAGASGFFIAATRVLAVNVVGVLLSKRHIPEAGPITAYGRRTRFDQYERILGNLLVRVMPVSSPSHNRPTSLRPPLS